MHHNKTILIVEDDAMLRKILRIMIEDKLSEWQVLEASNGKEGAVVAQTQRPDLILLDFYMPVMNGFEMALILKAQPETCNIPIVLISSACITDPQVAPLRQLCQGVLDKGKLFQELERMIQGMMNFKSYIV